MVDVNAVKNRLRINHTALDSQISEDIIAAQAELIRVGVDPAVFESDDSPLIDKAIKAYCLWIESSNDKMADGYEQMWNQWKDELRKSSGYKVNSNV